MEAAAAFSLGFILRPVGKHESIEKILLTR